MGEGGLSLWRLPFWLSGLGVTPPIYGKSFVVIYRRSLLRGLPQNRTHEWPKAKAARDIDDSFLRSSMYTGQKKEKKIQQKRRKKRRNDRKSSRKRRKIRKVSVWELWILQRKIFSYSFFYLLLLWNKTLQQIDKKYIFWLYEFQSIDNKKAQKYLFIFQWEKTCSQLFITFQTQVMINFC